MALMSCVSCLVPKAVEKCQFEARVYEGMYTHLSDQNFESISSSWKNATGIDKLRNDSCKPIICNPCHTRAKFVVGILRIRCAVRRTTQNEIKNTNNRGSYL